MRGRVIIIFLKNKEKKVAVCPSKAIANICFPSAGIYAHVKAFLPFPPPSKPLVWLRALCEPDLSAERWQISDMVYLFACFADQNKCLSVDKVQTRGLKRLECVCLVSLFLICSHTHTHTPTHGTASHVFLRLCGAPGSKPTIGLSCESTGCLCSITLTRCYGQVGKNMDTQ